MASRRVSLMDYKDDILRNLNEYRASSRLCDVTVVAQGKQFPAHRAVLAASCEFFRALLDADMIEKQDRVIELTAFEADTVELVLSFIYKGEIELTLGNAQAVLMASDFLLINKLKVAVDDFMSCNPEAFFPDILETFHFSIQYKCEKLKMASLKLARKSFEKTLESPEFLKLTLESLVEIITSGNLQVSSEEVVYRAIINWVSDNEDRRGSFHKLFSNLRLHSFNEEFLENVVMQEALVSGNPECLELVSKRIKSEYDPRAVDADHPRNCLDPYANAILVFPADKVRMPEGPFCFIPADSTFFKLNIRDTEEDNPGIGTPVYHNGVVFLVSCTPDNKNPNRLVIEQYDLISNSWSQRTTFPHYIAHFSAVCLKGKLYFIGGMRGEEESVPLVFSCDVSEPLQELTLKREAPMDNSRGIPRAFAYGNYIYVVGGISRRRFSYHKNYVLPVERYDPTTNSWTQVCQITKEQAEGGTKYTLMNGKIYMMGHRLNFVYDIDGKTLSEISKCPLPCIWGVLGVCQEDLYFLVSHGQKNSNGGRTGSPILKLDAGRFNMKSKSWDPPLCSVISYNYFAGPWKAEHVSLGVSTVRLPKRSLEGLKELYQI